MKTKRSNLKIIVSSLALAGMLSFALPAQAITVFDAANFVQNQISAAKSVLMEANTYKTLIEETKQTIAFMRSVASLNGLADLAGLQQELALYEELAQTTTEIQGVMGTSRALYADLNALMGAADGMNWATFLSAKNAVNNGRINTLMQQVDNANTELQQVQARRAVLLQKAQQAGANQSLMQAAQVTNGQLDTLIGQNQHLIALSTNRVADEAIKADRENQVEQAEQKARSEYQRRLRDSAAQIN